MVKLDSNTYQKIERILNEIGSLGWMLEDNKFLNSVKLALSGLYKVEDIKYYFDNLFRLCKRCKKDMGGYSLCDNCFIDKVCKRVEFKRVLQVAKERGIIYNKENHKFENKGV